MIMNFKQFNNSENLKESCILKISQCYKIKYFMPCPQFPPLLQLQTNYL